MFLNSFEKGLTISGQFGDQGEPGPMGAIGAPGIPGAVGRQGNQGFPGQNLLGPKGKKFCSFSFKSKHHF